MASLFFLSDTLLLWLLAAEVGSRRAGLQAARKVAFQGAFLSGSYMGFLSAVGNLNCAQAFTPEVVLRATAPGLALVAYGACARLIVSGPQTMFSWHMPFLIIGLLSGTRYCACCLTPSSPEGKGPSLGGQ